VLSRILVLIVSGFLFVAPLEAQKSSSHRKSSAPKQNTRGKGKHTIKASAERSRKLRHAFVASSSLKPMAKQLLADRSAAAYAGVERYAKTHVKEESGALANLVLGQAHLLDKQYQEAISPLSQASIRIGELGDYADYLLGTAYQGVGNNAKVAEVLKNFDTRHPNSLLTRDAALARANALIGSGDAAQAASVLEAVRQPARSDLELALGRAYAAQENNSKAASIFQHLYSEMPLSADAPAANAEIQALTAKGFVAALSYEQRRTRADLLMKGRRYSDAAQEYDGLLQSVRSDLNKANEQRVLEIKYAGALFRSGRKSELKPVLESIQQTDDEADAERLYYLHEIARNNDDGDQERKLIGDLIQRHPASSWLQEALLSASNMYLLRKDNEHAIEYYSDQYKLFPEGRYSPYSHWKAAWLSLRSGRNNEAKRLFEEQIQKYPGGAEIPAALYWRARLAEEDNDWNKAGIYYAALLQRYTNFYYAYLARPRFKFKFDTSTQEPALEKVLQAPDAKLNFTTPQDSLRYQRSRVLANGALFDFAIRELQAAAEEEPKPDVWPEIEIADIYLDMDRNDRALQTLKRAAPGYFAMDIPELPKTYWQILFPRPYWSDLNRYASANGLDSYLVASLIRQESEFNPEAVSRADAYGLMQLLPKVGKGLAKELRIRHFSTDDLTKPTLNLQLGTRYFKQMVDEFGGQVEYALAAYNAGSDRVKDWRVNGTYRDIAEFVESIPFTETREYVQAIMRNANIYRALYGTEDSAPLKSVRAAARSRKQGDD
jgi:soluble lytic murein transglycosylase